MAKMGRPPKPAAIKRMQGTWRADRDNNIDLMLLDKKPACPAHLTKQAKAEWRRIVGPLHDAGLVKYVDRAALATYCQAYGRWVEAERALSESIENMPGHGLSYATHNGNYVMNPLVAIARSAREEVRKAAGEFGMTPSSRSRITVKDSGKPEIDGIDLLMLQAANAPDKSVR